MLSINQIRFVVSFHDRDYLPKRYVNVKIPVELADEVDKILEKKLLGYRSRGEFVAEAVRDKLIQVKK
jgi:metal-responsive CopG/Arc/MetJ family transcriptional regulator